MIILRLVQFIQCNRLVFEWKNNIDLQSVWLEIDTVESV